MDNNISWGADVPVYQEDVTESAVRRKQTPVTKRYGVAWTMDEFKAVDALVAATGALGVVPPRGRSQCVAAAANVMAPIILEVAMKLHANEKLNDTEKEIAKAFTETIYPDAVQKS